MEILSLIETAKAYFGSINATPLLCWQVVDQWHENTQYSSGIHNT